MKSKLAPYETIEKAIGGDTASLLAIQQHYKPYITYLLCHGDTDLSEVLNFKLLEAILKFKLDYQPLGKEQSHEKPLFMRLADTQIVGVRCLYLFPQKHGSTV